MGNSVATPSSQMETLTCIVCHFQWKRRIVGGKKPTRCPECIKLYVPTQRGRIISKNNVSSRESGDVSNPDFLFKLLYHCELRLATEQAVALLKMGRPDVALAVLENVPARANR